MRTLQWYKHHNVSLNSLQFMSQLRMIYRYRKEEYTWILIFVNKHMGSLHAKSYSSQTENAEYTRRKISIK